MKLNHLGEELIETFITSGWEFREGKYELEKTVLLLAEKLGLEIVRTNKRGFEELVVREKGE